MNSACRFCLLIIAIGGTPLICCGDGLGRALESTPGEAEIRKRLPPGECQITTIRLWPNQAPDEPRPIPEEKVVQGKRGMQIQNVTQPSVMVELHVYERGGHAEGIHAGSDNQWPLMFEDWMRRRGILASRH